MFKKYTILIALLACSWALYAQETTFGLFLGGTNYKGDLSAKDAITFDGVNGAIGVQLKHQINTTLYVSGNLTVGKISGNDNKFSDRQEWTAPLNFSSILTELTANFEWHFIDKPVDDNNLNKRAYSHKLSPYVFGGIGFVHVNASVRGLPSDASEVMQGKDTGVYWSIPIGAGLTYHLNNQWSIDFEAGFRVPTTDLLDGVSTSRNPFVHDLYVIGGMSVNYRIGGE